MKKILFDLLSAQPSDETKFHGGGEHIKAVFKRLCDRYLNDIYLMVFYDYDKFLDDWILELIKKNNIKSYNIKKYSEINNLEILREIDVYYDGLMMGISKVNLPKETKAIGVYHGFRSLENPIDTTAPLYEETLKGTLKVFAILLLRKKYLERKYKETEDRINRCSDIVGVSEHSGYAARVFFPKFNKEHIHVYYSPEKNSINYNGRNLYNGQKYILLIGGNRWGKNSYRAIMAIDELFSNNQLSEYSVKIVGGIPKRIMNLIQNKQRFDSLGYLSSEELEMTYKFCELFVYPSLNEGFGYPPQEAMKYGKTCAISAVSSLTEIYKDSVYYFNPYDINEIKTRILQAIEQRIDEEIVYNAYSRIKIRQKKDLDKLCKLIVKE